MQGQSVVHSSGSSAGLGETGTSSGKVLGGLGVGTGGVLRGGSAGMALMDWAAGTRPAPSRRPPRKAVRNRPPERFFIPPVCPARLMLV